MSERNRVCQEQRKDFQFTLPAISMIWQQSHHDHFRYRVLVIGCVTARILRTLIQGLGYCDTISKAIYLSNLGRCFTSDDVRERIVSIFIDSLVPARLFIFIHNSIEGRLLGSNV